MFIMFEILIPWITLLQFPLSELHRETSYAQNISIFTQDFPLEYQCATNFLCQEKFWLLGRRHETYYDVIRQQKP